MIQKLFTEESSGIKFIKLPRGMWFVDGEFYDLNKEEKIIVNSDNPIIQSVKSNTIKTHYENADGEKLSLDKYQEKLNSLTKFGKYYDYEWIFENLDDEYNYKKFIQEWKPIKKDIMVKSDAYGIEYVNFQLQTGNSFIKSLFSFESKIIPNLPFQYDRIGAISSIIHNKMKELDFKYYPKIDYKDTKYKKVWGGDKPKWFTGFGTYFIPQKFQDVRNTNGTLEFLKSEYEKDKTELEEHIDTLYKVNFGDFDIEKVRAKELFDKLNIIHKNILSLNVLKGSKTDKRIILGWVVEAENILKNGFKIKID